MKKVLQIIDAPLRIMVLFAIRFYQNTLSFDHGPLAKVFPFFGCKFHPTCSEYTYLAVEKYGVFKGCWLGLKRVIRCNPFTPGGHDPLK